MGRKAVNDGKKKDEIIQAARDLFFVHGFDGTSVRSIMKKAGGEVGLFYYYFDNKDEVFDRVLDSFFSGYQRDFAAIIEHGRRNPCRLMYDFFTYMEKETALFRDRYAVNMHRTVRWAIREHTLEIIEPFVRQVIEIQSSYYQVEPALELDVVTIYLSYGVGSSILHENSDYFISKQREVQKGTSLLMNMPVHEQELRIPKLATADELDEIYEFLGEVLEDLLPLEELQEQVLHQGLWIFQSEGAIVGICGFERKTACIKTLYIKDSLRRKGLAHRLVESVSAGLDIGTVLSAEVGTRWTFEGGSFYKALGFEAVQHSDEGTLFQRKVPFLL